MQNDLTKVCFAEGLDDLGFRMEDIIDQEVRPFHKLPNWHIPKERLLTMRLCSEMQPSATAVSDVSPPASSIPLLPSTTQHGAMVSDIVTASSSKR